jgi:ADP-dependent NAD(P)H-hydrate dehydratase / NAD(P)H-hydrate epimerase
MSDLMPAPPWPLDAFDRPWPLHDVQQSRRIEGAAAAGLAPHTLMQRAGLSVARLALAVAPHARRIWVAAGPGNNGGDGLEAAIHLQRAGKPVSVSLAGDAAALPPDAAASLQRARRAGVAIDEAVSAPAGCDLVIDAVLGLGASRAPDGALALLARAVNASTGVRLAIDLPSGLAADTGAPLGEPTVRATHTLALLTLKPGLFTGQGRDRCGALWFDDLGCGAAAAAVPPRALLGDADSARHLRATRGHAGHKGAYGDVVAVGGAAGMSGALTLAARAALAGGAGRVLASALDPTTPSYDASAPELMWRPQLWTQAPSQWSQATVVCGCGGGHAVREALPVLLSRSARLVLDADALNAIAHDTPLQSLLVARASRGLATVLTPHPLEAARLLALPSADQVQSNRLAAAQSLAHRFECTVLLKGSGSVIAAPRRVAVINPTGNARLSGAGTGDVLAGWLAGLWSASAASGAVADGFVVARSAAYWHGAAAQYGDPRHGAAAQHGGPASPLSASALIEALARA